MSDSEFSWIAERRSYLSSITGPAISSLARTMRKQASGMAGQFNERSFP
jgi:hypothetical protein